MTERQYAKFVRDLKQEFGRLAKSGALDGLKSLLLKAHPVGSRRPREAQVLVAAEHLRPSGTRGSLTPLCVLHPARDLLDGTVAGVGFHLIPAGELELAITHATPRSKLTADERLLKSARRARTRGRRGEAQRAERRLAQQYLPLVAYVAYRSARTRKLSAASLKAGENALRHAIRTYRVGGASGRLLKFAARAVHDAIMRTSTPLPRSRPQRR
ncbi:MAG TPA: hypothetical protein VGB20_04680 [bacterium]